MLDSRVMKTLIDPVAGTCTVIRYVDQTQPVTTHDLYEREAYAFGQQILSLRGYTQTPDVEPGAVWTPTWYDFATCVEHLDDEWRSEHPQNAEKLEVVIQLDVPGREPVITEPTEPEPTPEPGGAPGEAGAPVEVPGTLTPKAPRAKA